jgi:hypothetical protein
MGARNRMSQKWRDVKRWDDEHLTGWKRPLWYVLRTFSAITFAVVLLTGVMVYGLLASIPIGLLALAPTYLLYALTLLIPVAGVGVLVWVGVSRAMGGAGRGARFSASFGASVIAAGVVLLAWSAWVWPALRYDAGTGEGLRLFAGFVEAHKSNTIRRLPILEMSELEFYSWWPLRVILLLFVFNLVIATVRRIEFKFVNIGVLTVHTGIVLIALGSVYYAGLKLEGDTLLIAGPLDPQTGRPTVGPPQRAFYDNTDVALWLEQGRGWTQRPLSGVPRYNDYNLRAGAEGSVREQMGRFDVPDDGGRTLNIGVPAPEGSAIIDLDINLRIVGYASYAEPVRDWVPVEADGGERGGAGGSDGPLRFVQVRIDAHAAQTPEDVEVPFFMLPQSPTMRFADMPVLVLEHTQNLPEARWEALRQPLPEPGQWGLVIDVPGADPARGAGHRQTVTVQEGDTIEVGDTGFAIEVRQLLPEPPFPIITPGYEGATSSIAVLGITTPEGETYERWVYSRFPEISQDMLSSAMAGEGESMGQGRPSRRAADPAISIHLIDATRRHVLIDETPGPGGAIGPARALVRSRGGEVTEHADLAPGAEIPALAGVAIRRADGWPGAREVLRPRTTPEEQRERERIGSHDAAMVAVELTLAGDASYRQLVWVPFRRYVLEMADGSEPRITLPDGRTLRMVFGRVQHRLPGFEVRLVDFQMIAYDHRGAPRDYQSALHVAPTPSWDGSGPDFAPFTHVAKLNAPLQAPFMWSEGRQLAANVAGYVRARLNPAQFKFSQAGWDAEGWRQTQALADQGQIPSPYAQFTILQVGNNPGIHIIALGGILMGVGIPWAFYIKPWILRRRKLKLQKSLGLRAIEPKPAREAAAAGVAAGAVS